VTKVVKWQDNEASGFTRKYRFGLAANRWQLAALELLERNRPNPRIGDSRKTRFEMLAKML
jgi:hypothetical protein